MLDHETLCCRVFNGSYPRTTYLIFCVTAKVPVQLGLLFFKGIFNNKEIQVFNKFFCILIIRDHKKKSRFARNWFLRLIFFNVNRLISSLQCFLGHRRSFFRGLFGLARFVDLKSGFVQNSNFSVDLGLVVRLERSFRTRKIEEWSPKKEFKLNRLN